MGIDGNRLKKLRLAKGLTPGQMATMLSISRQGYLKYETGETRTPRKLEELAAFFSVSTDYLLGKDDAPTTHKPPASPSLIDDLLRELFADRPDVITALQNQALQDIDDNAKALIKNSILAALQLRSASTAEIIGHKILQASPDAQMAIDTIIQADNAS